MMLSVMGSNHAVCLVLHYSLFWGRSGPGHITLPRLMMRRPRRIAVVARTCVPYLEIAKGLHTFPK